MQNQQSNYEQLPPEAIRWLANGQRGTSSNTLISILYGINALGGSMRDSPHDPGDLRRCRLMIDAIPGAADRLATLSDVYGGPRARVLWLKLADNWSLMCGLMDAELPAWRHPPPQYRLPRLSRFMREMQYAADNATRALPEAERLAQSGRDLLQASARVTRKVEPEVLAAQLRSLLEMPVVEHMLDGKAAFTVLAMARDELHHQANATSSIEGRGRPEAASHVLAEIAAMPNIQAPPRSNLAMNAVRRALFVAMDHLWVSSRQGLKEDAAAADKFAYQRFAYLHQILEGLKVTSEETFVGSSASSPAAPRRKSAP